MFNFQKFTTMKKIMFWSLIALATLSMTSCSQDETLEARPQENAIEFGTYLGRDVQTRGVVLTDANLENMGVFAFYTGQKTWVADSSTLYPNFMHNQLVTYNNRQWSYSPLKYWPTTQNDKITFFAYAPAMTSGNGITAVSAIDKTGTPTVTYTIDEKNLENMADFVADAMIDITQSQNILNSNYNEDSIDNANRTVQFQLNHELTRVNIKAKLNTVDFDGQNNTTKVNITDIKFFGPGFATSATYTFAKQNDILDANGGTTKYRGTWGSRNSNEVNEQTEAISIFDNDDTAYTGDAKFVNKVQGLRNGNQNYKTYGVEVSSTTAVDLFVKDSQTTANNEYLFLIPVDGGTTTGKEVYMEVSYDIVTFDDKLNDGLSVTPATKVIKLQDSLLQQGVAYNILLTFGLNEIELTANVAEDWNTPTDYNHNVDWPKNKTLN